MIAALEKFNLQGKTALVTGGSEGLGLEMARGLGQMGARVLIAARREEMLKHAAEELMADPEITAEVLWHRVDLADLTSIRELADYIDAEFGGVDIFVGNAGTEKVQYIGQIDTADAEHVIRVNLTSNIVLINSLVPGMRSKKWGRVIFSSSISGEFATANDGISVYGCTKAGINQLARYIAAEAGPDGVTANSLAIGAFETEMAQRVEATDPTGMFVNGNASATSIGRWGLPSELIGIVQLLASDAGSYITGAVIPVDGGISSTYRSNVTLDLSRATTARRAELDGTATQAP